MGLSHDASCLHERTYRYIADGILIDGHQREPNVIAMQTNSPDPRPVTSASRPFQCGVSAIVTKNIIAKGHLKRVSCLVQRSSDAMRCWIYVCSRTFRTRRVDHWQSHGNPTNRDYDMSAKSFISRVGNLAVHSCLTVIGIV